jgi:hypothetical protein
MDNTTAATGAGVAGAMIVLVFVGLYFLPTIIAAMRHKSNTVAIGALNFLFGWTVLGWVICFIWSLLTPPQPQTIILQQGPQPPSIVRDGKYGEL